MRAAATVPKPSTSLCMSRRKWTSPLPDERQTLPPNDANDEPEAVSTESHPLPPPGLSPARAAGERAIMNTVYRSGGEIAGRFASLLLFAVAGHTLGQDGLGAFVFGLAFTGFVMIPVGLGLDRYILRVIAADRASAHSHFFNVIALKVALAVPLFALSFLALHLIGYGHQAQATAWVLAPGVFADSIARTQLSVFQAHE